MNPERLQRGLLLGTALALAFALKRHYSLAGADDLTWILSPTAMLVERLSGHPFSFEIEHGFVNTELGLAITPACAGVNFLIIVVLSLTLGVVWRLQGAWLKLGGLVVSAALGYAATLLVNSLRILMALVLQREHRVEGALLYLTALCLLYATALNTTRRLKCATREA